VGPNAGRELRSGKSTNEVEVRGVNSIWVAITDQRILIKLPKVNVSGGFGLIDPTIRSIDYGELVRVTLDRVIVINRITFTTVSSQKNHVAIKKPQPEECQKAVEFIENKIPDTADLSNRDTADEETDSGPLDKIEKLQELRDSGAITDDEFEKKKEELLDQI
jgi:hypothetical protein